ncbi:hypothetical protein M569_08652, partial [Genlisea aurea]
MRILAYHTSWFRLLRVLDVTFEILDSVPFHHLGQLLLLRYLSITFTYTPPFTLHDQIPQVVQECRNLQVLRIDLKCRCVCIPLEFSQLSKFRHIILPGLELRIGTSGGGFLKNLQTLCGVVNFSFTEEVIQMVPNLKMLELLYTNIRRHAQNYEFSPEDISLDFVNLSKLEILRFSSHILGVWRNFRLPLSLKKLSLLSCRLPWKKLGVIAGSLPKLEAMELKCNACDGKVWKVKQGDFPNLRMLKIDGTDLVSWKYGGGEGGGYIFPRLEHLVLLRCECLRELPRCFKQIETGMLIEVDKSNELVLEWTKDLKVEQECYGNEDFQILVHADELSGKRVYKEYIR